MNKLAGAILLSTAGIVGTAGGIAEQVSSAHGFCWQSAAAALILGGVGLFLLFDKHSN